MYIGSNIPQQTNQSVNTETKIHSKKSKKEPEIETVPMEIKQTPLDALKKILEEDIDSEKYNLNLLG